MAESTMLDAVRPQLQSQLAEPPPTSPPSTPAAPVASSAGRGPLAYAELHCLSSFSFLRGASSPAQLVHRAKSLGYSALALTDECSVAGAVRAHEAALACDLHLIHGSEFVWGALKIVVLARDLQGWGNLCEFITAARAAAPKGQYHAGPGSPFRLR